MSDPLNAVELEGEEVPQEPQYSPNDVLEQLESIPAGSRSYTAATLTESLRAQRRTVIGLRDRIHALQENPESETLSSVNALLLEWLRSCYLQASALPALGKGRVSSVALNVAMSGMLAPFILEVLEDGRINPGLPTNHDVHYLTEPSTRNAVPSDDAALLLASIAIRSMKNSEMCEAADVEAKELMASVSEATEVPPGMESCPAYAPFGTAEIMWLLYLIRSELSSYFADVQFLMDDREKHKENLIARNQDNMLLVKAVPNNLQGYLRYCRCCLEFQQTQRATARTEREQRGSARAREGTHAERSGQARDARTREESANARARARGAAARYARHGARKRAHGARRHAALLFCDKALSISEELNDDVFRSNLLLVKAVSLALGAAGPTFSLQAASLSLGATGPTFSLQDIINLQAGSETAVTKYSEWLPEAYTKLMSHEPETTIVSEHVLQHYLQASNDTVEALAALYTIKAPDSVPPGATTEETGEDLGAVEEEGEGSEDAPQVPVKAKPSKGRGGGRAAAGGRGAKKAAK
eukprot:gene10311-8242_t